MRHIVLFGAGGHSKVVREIIRQLHGQTLEAWIVAVYDEYYKEAVVDGDIPVIRTTAELDGFVKAKGEVHGIIGIGDNHVRKAISETIQIKYCKAIHPTAIVAKDVTIGEGTVIMPGTIINPGVKIGKHCIINSGAIIEHDCIIGDYAHISPGATLTGGVTVGKLSHIGTGAQVIPQVIIGQEVVVGAGAVVIRNIPDQVVVAGVPAKPIKKNDCK